VNLTSPHQRHQVAGNAQPQPGSAILAGGRTVHLPEGFKDHLLLIGRDADPGIGDGETQSGRALRFLFRFRRHRHDHFPLLGELDRVADQIGQHLSQPSRIAYEHFRDVRDGLISQLQPLAMGLDSETSDRVIERVGQVKRGVIEGQPFRLDLGQIQDIVDEGQKAVRRILDHLHAFSLFFGEPGVEDQVGHADDGVHGCTNLMAHIGQELTLRDIRRFRAAARLNQIGHIHHIQQNPFVGPASIDGLHPQDHFHVAHGPLDEHGFRSRLFAKTPDDPQNTIQTFAGMQFFDAFPDQLLPFPLHKPCKPLVDLHHYAVGISKNNPFLHAGKHGRKLCSLLHGNLLG